MRSSKTNWSWAALAVMMVVTCSTGTVGATESSVELPELVVKAGTSYPIAAQRWEYRRVEIHEGATLAVQPGGSNVLHLVVRGPMILKGTIVAERFSSDDRQVTVAVPGRPPLTLEYASTNKGGAGGNGGSAAGVQSGTGAAGSLEYGGGGGAGGGRFADATGVKRYPGASAQGERGAQGGPGDCGRSGGNAGMRSNLGNGGIVYLEVHGDFDGSNGRIQASGARGENGADGGTGYFPNSSYGCQSGAGGGGGGAPGGHGGFVVGYVSGNVVAYPQVISSGGEGGNGGASPGHFPGAAGGKGQRGKSGNAYWFTPTP